MNEALTDSEETATENVEQQEASAVSDCENTFEEVGKHYEGQDNADFSDDFDSENEEEDLGEKQNESRNVGVSIRI